ARQERPVVVTSTTVFADLVQQVAGDLVEVRSLVGIGGDPHTHEPRPSDAIAVAEADLVVDGGLGLSPWLAPLLRARRGPTVDLGQAAIEVARTTGGTVDPHVWMAPDLVARYYLPVIADALRGLVPDAAPVLARRTRQAQDALRALDAEIALILDVIPPHRRLLVTSHDAYSYFADAYDLTVVGTVVGSSTEEEPSARTVAALIDQITALEVPAVFIESTVNPQVIRRIAADAGVAVGAPLYGDSLGPPGSGAETYADMLRTNARHLADGLR
ncbi:MAG TPA: zinc ABC transporter substrate-binding protein, partial [Euzebya sp.]|nr:zinc ABC transporter substrate-binding protein [Euzebya sp.]